VGGPITEVGEPYIPIPMISLGYNLGIIDTLLNFESGINITSALYGVLHLDLGVNYRPFNSNKWRPGLMVTPKIFIMTDFQPETFRIWPDLSITGFWEIKKYWYIYTGLESFFEFSKTRSDGNKQEHHWIIAPYLGFNLGKEKWQFQIEYQIYTINLNNELSRSMENLGYGDYGVHGIFLGVNYTFKKREK
jgi:hypothetical protein